MNILLCTPFSSNSNVVQGGIAIWARNIMNYYESLKDNEGLLIDVISFDRKVRRNISDNCFLLKRAWYGFVDYLNPIHETQSKLKDGNIDLLHLCTSASISLIKDILILKIAKRHGVKTTIHFHFGRIPELCQQSNWEWKLIRRVAYLADSVITIDNESYNTLINSGINNVFYLPNPLSLSITSQIKLESPTIVRDEKKVCFVGHVIETKGVFELVKACVKIDGIILNIIGKVSSDVQKKLQMLAGEGEWLVFKGEINHDQVIREMLSSNIFVLPTYTEGFPNVILESMACGCAIVTTPVGAIPEMLNIDSSDPCGLCCSPKDDVGIRRNIQYLLDHPEEAQLFADRAIKRVNKIYAMPQVWKQLVDIWKKCHTHN